MKITAFLFSIPLLIFCFSLNISAQEDLPKYQAYSVGTDVVKSSMIVEYEKALKDYISLYADANYPYPIYMYSTDDYCYFYVTPILPAYSGLDSLRKYVNLVYKANPEKWDETYSKFEETYDYYKQQVIILNRELSYEAENPRLKPGEQNFHYWVYTFVKPGKTNEFIEIIKKWKELYKSKNIADSYSVYYGDYGTEEPMFIWHMTGKNAGDFWQNDAAINEILGEEAHKLFEETSKLTRKIETKSGWYREEFSYYPKKK